MDRPRIYVDFNEMLEDDLVLLSKYDHKVDSTGNIISFYEGMSISIYTDDVDDNGKIDNLIADGVVELNIDKGWSAHVKWCCRINELGIKHESDLK